MSIICEFFKFTVFMYLLIFIMTTFIETSQVGSSFSFHNLSNAQKTVVNDSVMGGRSSSQFINEDNHLVFSGNVSLENNGGFASLRMLWPFDGENDANTIRISVKGDGKKYQFRLRTNRGFDGAAYVHEFQTTNDTWQTIEMPVTDFVPSFRGRVLQNMPDLRLSDVQQMGILIADKQIGSFTITLGELTLLNIQ